MKLKIDGIVDEVSSTCRDLILITNKETIDLFFDEIHSLINPSHGGGITYKMDEKEKRKKIKRVSRGSVTLHFIDEEDIDLKMFHDSISDDET